VNPPDPHAQELLRLAASLAGSFGHERSCRFVSGRVLDVRHLVSFSRASLRCECDALLDRLRSGFGWPGDDAPDLRALWGRASHVHLGVESGPGRTVMKLYLESEDADLEEQPLADPVWGAVHRAFKWTPDGQGGVRITDYDALLAPGVGRRRALVDQVLGAAPGLRAVMFRLVSLAGSPGAMLLRVTERGTGRASVDVNLYPTNLRVGDLRALLAEAACAAGVSAADAAAWLTRIADAQLGHFAAGFDGEGRPFATVYHGVHECDGACLT
jgi:hypothetical protein